MLYFRGEQTHSACARVPVIVANKPRRVAAIAVRLIRVEVMVVQLVVDEMLWLLFVVVVVVLLLLLLLLLLCCCCWQAKFQIQTTTHPQSKKQTAPKIQIRDRHAKPVRTSTYLYVPKYGTSL
jgi:hypothetical protein